MLRTKPAYTVEDLRAKGFDDMLNEELIEYYGTHGCSFPIENLDGDGCFWVADITEPYEYNKYSNEWEVTQVIPSDETECGYIFIATSLDKCRNGNNERKVNIEHTLIPENCIII